MAAPTDVVARDLFDQASLDRVFAGIDVAFYWFVLLPVHALILEGLLRAIARRALGQPRSPVA